MEGIIGSKMSQCPGSEILFPVNIYVIFLSTVEVNVFKEVSMSSPLPLYLPLTVYLPHQSGPCSPRPNKTTRTEVTSELLTTQFHKYVSHSTTSWKKSLLLLQSPELCFPRLFFLPHLLMSPSLRGCYMLECQDAIRPTLNFSQRD